MVEEVDWPCEVTRDFADRQHRPQAPAPLRARRRLSAGRPGDRAGGRLPPGRDLLPLLRRAARALRRRRPRHARRGEPAPAPPAGMERELPLLPLRPHLGVGDLAPRLAAFRRRAAGVARPRTAASGRRGSGRCSPRSPSAATGATSGTTAREIENWDAQWSYALLARRRAGRQPESQPDLQHRLRGGRDQRDRGSLRHRGSPPGGDASSLSSIRTRSSATTAPTRRRPSSSPGRPRHRRRPRSASAPGPRRCGRAGVPSTSSRRRSARGSATATASRASPRARCRARAPRGRRGPSSPRPPRRRSVGSQPSSRLAFDASATSSSMSAGRARSGSTRTWSSAFRPTQAKAASTRSRTEWETPVPIT